MFSRSENSETNALAFVLPPYQGGGIVFLSALELAELAKEKFLLWRLM